MENLIPLLLPAVLSVMGIGLMLKPMKWALRAALHGFGGFACLWLINSASVFTGLSLPLNAATVLLSGTLGIPGIALVALLEVL